MNNCYFIEDIIDSGLTVERMLDRLEERGARSVEIVTCLFKPEMCQRNYPIKWIGFSIPPEFIIGYGLDVDEFGRNLPDIYQLTSEL